MNRYVLDANVLFSGVISQKAIYRAMFDENVFYTPDFALAELNTYRKIFLKKSTVKKIDLKEFTLFLFSRIIVVPDYIISENSYNIAEELVADIDPKDVAYVALNEELNTILLTRDKVLYDGLLAKGYTRIQLFNDFIASQINEKEINETTPPAGALAGLLFAALWASASVATKFGVQSVHPLILANVRFFIAGGGMLLFAYAIQRTKNAWPVGIEWRQLTIFALLNTTIYLGAFVLALKQVSAGIGSLSTATNPLFIALLSAVWLRRMPRWNEAGGLLLGLLGVGIATYPLLQNSYATVEGLLILLVGMVSVSAATVYYARIDWQLPSLVINGWQVLLGGLLLLPFTLLVAVITPTEFKASQYDERFWASVFWLILPVSVAALQLWFYLVRQDPIRASLWLFLCPIFGFAYSYLLMGEPITGYTIVGTALVIGGLWLGRR